MRRGNLVPRPNPVEPGGDGGGRGVVHERVSPGNQDQFVEGCPLTADGVRVFQHGCRSGGAGDRKLHRPLYLLG